MSITTRKVSIAAIVVSATLSIMASSASASGWIADTFIRPISPKAADLADRTHRELGKPLDRIPGQTKRYISFGEYVGDYCDTPIGVFGPGPLRPIGAPCYARGYRGFIVD